MHHKRNTNVLEKPFFAIIHSTQESLPSIIFSDNEISLLNKEMNYNFPKPNNNKNIVSEMLRSEAILKTLENTETCNLASVILNNKFQKNFNSPNSLITSSSLIFKQESLRASDIKSKLIVHDAQITKADKRHSMDGIHAQSKTVYL